MIDLDDVRHVGRIVHLDDRAVVHMQMIDDARRGRDEIEIEFALEPLGDDLEMQQPEEAAAEAEAQRRGAFRFEREACIVEAKPAHRVAQVFEFRGVDGKEAAEDDGLRRLEARQGFSRRIFFVRDRIADARVGDFLDRGGEEADFARAELIDAFPASGGKCRRDRPDSCRPSPSA